MAYGEGGKSIGYNATVEGTGGYCQVLLEKTTPFPGYDYWRDSGLCFGIKSYVKGAYYGD